MFKGVKNINKKKQINFQNIFYPSVDELSPLDRGRSNYITLELNMQGLRLGYFSVQLPPAPRFRSLDRVVQTTPGASI